MPVAEATAMETKVFRFSNLKLDSAGEGTFEAVFATLDAIDHDGDTYDPGAIGSQEVVISQWNHGSWGEGADALPIGVGKIFERDNEAIVAGEFDLADPDGQKTYNKLKYLNDKGRTVEWSFALPNAEWRWERRDDQELRVFTHIDVPEVSPVLLGAGINTRMTAIKNREGSKMDQDKDKSIAFVKQLDEAVETVESVLARAKEIRNLRAKSDEEGMSRRSTRRLKALREAMAEAIEDVDELLTNPNDELKELAAQIQGGHKDGA